LKYIRLLAKYQESSYEGKAEDFGAFFFAIQNPIPAIVENDLVFMLDWKSLFSLRQKGTQKGTVF